jgi:hypothetical protein
MEEVYSIVEEGPDPYRTRFVELELDPGDDIFFIASRVPETTSETEDLGGRCPPGPVARSTLHSSSIYPSGEIPSTRYSQLDRSETSRLQ